ncbi:hypothetical protein HYFRA_00010965 [Hymenoscyphus fraxineus]|uniref:Uncharacterized protein n=1 Tax=Hymenoscyphus fraxineus TaxID=746836 RepID=A0A9N9PJE2_9HELO|nr:hypothetical protein HYFRA_00010965 [Hymenoscyphus fraxineus]
MASRDPQKTPLLPIQVPYRILLKGLYRTEFQRTYKRHPDRMNYFVALNIVQGDIPTNAVYETDEELVKRQITKDLEFINRGSYRKAIKELRVVWEWEKLCKEDPDTRDQIDLARFPYRWALSCGGEPGDPNGNREHGVFTKLKGFLGL